CCLPNFCPLNRVCLRLQRLQLDPGHCLGQNTSIHSMWCTDSKDLQDRWRKIDIATWQIIYLAAAEIRSSCDEHIVHIKSAERGVCSLSRRALPVGIDHTRNAELIFIFVPAK